MDKLIWFTESDEKEKGYRVRVDHNGFVFNIKTTQAFSLPAKVAIKMSEDKNKKIITFTKEI